MTEEYENSLRLTRRQSRELHFHNWDSFDQTRGDSSNADDLRCKDANNRTIS
jgi:hypothetical protein